MAFTILRLERLDGTLPTPPQSMGCSTSTSGRIRSFHHALVLRSGAVNESLGNEIVALHRLNTPDSLAVVASNHTTVVSAEETLHGKVNVYDGHEEEWSMSET